MFQVLDHRPGHYALLALVWAIVCLPNLGGPSLWDIDEGNNSQCSREMLDSDNWVVPTFNYQLRDDKPALLYWLQAGAYSALGVDERSARLPSALSALVAILCTYELGRQTFGKRVGLLAGVILASAVCFTGAARFANPDALLTACTTLTLLIFWHDYRHGAKGWFALTGLTTGLGVLAKGPVGLVLPTAVTILFLHWRRQLGRLLDRRLAGAALLFTVVAIPWYLWVAIETKGAWLVGFWTHHHAARMTTALENHGGPVFYYLLILVLGLAPWSVFLLPAGWHAARGLRKREEAPGAPRAAFQYLLAWVAVYLLFFSLVRTKLPNYVLPLYPAVALLIAHFLDEWRRGRVSQPAWVMRVSLACLALGGVAVAGGLLVAGGVIDLPVLRGRRLPGLEGFAWLGGVLPAGALLGGWCLRRDLRGGLVAAVAGASVLFTAGLLGWGPEGVDRYKAVRPLVGALPADQLEREVRVGAYAYFRPSLVFYCGREVERLGEEWEVREFLSGPLPSYLFLPEPAWARCRDNQPAGCRLVARHHDLYAGYDVVVVTNEPGGEFVSSP